MKTNIIGKPLDRKDARLKVTGAARYAAEFPVQNMAYAFPVRSTIGNGRVTAIDTTAAEKSPGVLAVITRQNAPRLKEVNIAEVAALGTIPGEMLLPLQDDKVYYVGQYIGLVVAETYEQARQAAALVKVNYEAAQPAIELEKEKAKGYRPEKFFGFEDVQIRRGDATTAMNAAEIKFEQTYRTPTENHHPMEPHASIAVWDDSAQLTVYDATQAVKGTQVVVAQVLGMKTESVRVLSPFVGGGFGCKGLIWMHPVLAAIAARQVKRPVKLVLTRQMMQTNIGHRGETIQKVSLGANRDGKMTAIRHLTDTYTSNGLSEFFEPCGLTTRLLYACPNVEITHTVARLNVGTPTPMRAPGEAPGTFAFESAVDELAAQLKMDPIQLRLINHADVNPQTNLPWSSKQLKECYRIGAERFGWNKRQAEPRALRDGKFLIGYGMATSTYPGYRSAASARVRLNADGSAIAYSATQDIGTGTYTVLAQIAADVLGVAVERVRAEIGDSNFPTAPVSGGSQTVASVGPAVHQAAEMVRMKVIELATKDKASPLFGKTENEIGYGDGRIFLKNETAKGETYADVLSRARVERIEECVTTTIPTPGQSAGSAPPCTPYQANSEQNSDHAKYAFQSHGAQFAEVRVDEDLGTIRVSRFVSVQDVGRVMNAKTARSQVYSGVIYGIGMALMEETHYDPRTARPVMRTLADYHVPVNLDVPDIDVSFINQPDPHINPIGARGIGEIGVTGVAAAIANAVFNATGKRIRDLPMTPDKLL